MIHRNFSLDKAFSVPEIMLVSTKRNFGSHKFGKKAYSNLVPFFSLCKASTGLADLFGCCSVKFMKENGCLCSSVRPRCDKRTYCFLFLKAKHAASTSEQGTKSICRPLLLLRTRAGKKMKET